MARTARLFSRPAKTQRGWCERPTVWALRAKAGDRYFSGGQLWAARGGAAGDEDKIAGRNLARRLDRNEIQQSLFALLRNAQAKELKGSEVRPAPPKVG